MILFPAVKGGRWGYIDSSGKLQIDYQFEHAGRFSEGLACVRPLGEATYGYVNQAGALVIPARFHDCGPFSEDLASATVGDKTGYIDSLGEMRFYVAGCRLGRFQGGLAHVQLHSNERSGESFIDRMGKEVLAARNFALSTSKLGEGLINAATRTQGDRWGYIAPDGEFKIPAKFRYARPFFDGLAAVAKGPSDSHFSFINPSGDEVIPGPFAGADIKFQEGRCAVWNQGAFGFIDRSGALAVPYRFYYADHYSEGMTRVKQRESDEKYGYANLDGNLVIRQVFSVTSPFRDGLAWVTLRFKTTDPAYGYINSSGEFVWGPSR